MENSYTQSELSVWDDCPRKHDFQFRQMLEIRNASPSWPLVYGSAVHSAIDKWRQGNLAYSTNLELDLPEGILLTEEDEKKRDYYTELLRVQVERYMIYYAADFEEMKILHTEETLGTNYMGVDLEGKIDLVFKYGKLNCMSDTKTAGRFDPATYESWQFKFQFMFYMWLLQRCKAMTIHEMWIDVIIKPALRQGKNESQMELIGRIRQDMIQDPSKYFKRVKMHNLKGAMAKFEKDVLLPKIDRILTVESLLTSGGAPDILNLLTRNMNTNNCVKFGSSCAFLPLCAHGQAEAFRYQVREHKHVELIAEAD